MYSSSRKVRASVRRTILLIIISCLGSLVLIETIVEFNNNTEYQLTPTRSAGLMLNRSQMLLAKEFLLEPSLFTCMTKPNNDSSTNHSSVMYPLHIIVKTRAESSGYYFQRRMFTRTSWGREARSLGIPVIYTVGRAKDDQVQKMLEYESKTYGDMLQFNYIDAYYNITIKTTGILNWFVTRGCHHSSPYLFVVDDDVLINIQFLLKTISENIFKLNTLYGLYLSDIEPHPSGKWAVSLEDFPNRTYPAFITGASTLYPTSVIDPIVKQLFYMINQNNSMFFLDDVLISGIIAEQLGIQRAPMSGIAKCASTILSTRVIISECDNARRLYIWSKFLLSRTGQNTDEINRLIKTTSYIPWRAGFKQRRDGTPIISTNAVKTLDNSILIIITGFYPRILFVVLFIAIIVFISIFISKIICWRQSTVKKLPFNSISSRPISSMLLVPVK